MLVNHDFFVTRIQINVSWSGSRSGQMIRIQPDPDPDPKNLVKSVKYRIITSNASHYVLGKGIVEISDIQHLFVT